MKKTPARIAVSPAAWGVSDAPGWGHQLAAEHVLAETAKLGVTAIESGPAGFLPDRSDQARRLLKLHRLSVIAGTVRAILHHHDIRGTELAHIDGHAAWLSALGAQTLVLVAIPSRDADSHSAVLSNTGWAHLLHSIGSVEHVCSRHRLRVAVQPEFGSMINSPDAIERLLVGSEAGLCIDTGQLLMCGADPLDVLGLAADRFRHVRLSDVNRSKADLVNRERITYLDGVRDGLYTALGAGDARIAEIVEEIRRSRYGGWYAIDEPAYLMSSAVSPDITASLEFLRRLLA